MFVNAPVYANDEPLLEYEYNEEYAPCDQAPLGYQTSSAARRTVSMSMVGWGLGLAIAIAIVAGVIHQSTSSHSSSSSSSPS